MLKKSVRTDERKIRKGLKRVAVVAATAIALVAISSTPAVAINQPDPFSCAWNRLMVGDYLYLKIGTYNQSAPWTPLCFVNAGTDWDMKLVTGVVGLHSGNNAGIINSKTILWAFPKWHDDFTYYGDMIMLTIF